jgi:quinoprotein dehydrogenase-associated probable ABC transporter substrate-binding protein
MSSGSDRRRRGGAFAAGLLAAALAAACQRAPSTHRSSMAPADDAALRVCADPNNLPFSNERGEGFENALAELIAADLGRRVQYTWWPQRRGFIRMTLNAGVCDVVMGLPEDFEMASTTDPYYRSSYAFVTKRRQALGITSMDDPRLRELSIGIHLVGDDYASVPPGDALVSRGIVRNVRGYTLYGDYSKPNPPANLIDAVAGGEVDVAIAWGPLAGFFAARSPVPLDVRLVEPIAGVPFEFSIAMGVRRGDEPLRRRLDDVLSRRRADVDRVLDRFDIPVVPMPAASEARR